MSPWKVFFGTWRVLSRSSMLLYKIVDTVSNLPRVIFWQCIKLALKNLF